MFMHWYCSNMLCWYWSLGAILAWKHSGYLKPFCAKIYTTFEWPRQAIKIVQSLYKKRRKHFLLLPLQKIDALPHKSIINNPHSLKSKAGCGLANECKQAPKQNCIFCWEGGERERLMGVFGVAVCETCCAAGNQCDMRCGLQLLCRSPVRQHRRHHLLHLQHFLMTIRTSPPETGRIKFTLFRHPRVIALRPFGMSETLFHSHAAVIPPQR